MKPSIVAHLALSLALFSSLSACSSSGNKDDAGDVDARTSEMIGPAGGTVALDGARLVIPPGALAQDTNIVIELVARDLSGLTRLSPLVSLEPNGLTFQIPATLTIDFSGTDPSMLRADTIEGPYAPFAAATYDGTVATASLNGFSTYVVAQVVPASPLFEINGVGYSPAPVAMGVVEGFAYSTAAGAGVDDGAGGPGRVWYGDSDCWTFRMDGTGIADTAGGRDAHRAKFPILTWSNAPNQASATIVALGNNLGGIVDPDYDRSSELWNFKWGVRLNSNGSVYEDLLGNIEFGFEFESADAPWSADTHNWKVGDGPSAFGVLDSPSEDPPTNQHFCRFRSKRVNVVGDDGLVCLETERQFTSIVENACYANGMLQGPFSAKLNGETVESGAFNKNNPAGGWTVNFQDGRSVSGAFDDAGIPMGKWDYFSAANTPIESSTLSGNMSRTAFGVHYEVQGEFIEYFSGNMFPPGSVREKGNYAGGFKDAWWMLFDRPGRVDQAEQYDASHQIPTGGKTCATPPGQPQVCVDSTRSDRVQRISYSWGECISGVNFMTVTQFDDQGRATSTTCFDTEGPQDAPTKGAERDCPGVCQS